MRFAMMMTIGVLAGSAHTQPSTAGPGEPGRVLAPQKISNTAAASADLGDQLFKLLPNDGAADDRFGWSVAISGATAIVGAYVDDDNGTDSGSAYLFDAGAPGTCPWDVNGDGVVNHHDILEVVHNMGPCDDPDNCPWDVNGDGTVNGRDVAAVATHFGPCP